MRSYSFDIPFDRLRTGIRPDENIPPDILTLYDAFNVRATDFGLEAPRTITVPATHAVSWPFPQVFKGNFATFVCSETKIYVLEGSSLTELVEVDSGGGMWHFLDMHNAVMFTNGDSVVWTRSPAKYHDMTGAEFNVNTTPTIGTCCYHRGRAILAGFDSLADFGKWKVIDENFVVWSSIGGGDVFRAWNNDSSDDISHFEENTSGSMAMPSSGRVLAVKSLGKDVVVYSEDSVNLLVQVVEPTSTFGLQEIAKIGIKGRGAVCGSDYVHYFISNTSELYRLSADEGLQRLGFNRFFSGMTGSNIMATYDSSRGEAYISDGTTGCIITASGLTRVAKMPTSVYVGENGTLYGYTKDSAEIAVSNAVYVVTNDIQMATRAMKTINMVEAGISGISGGYARVYRLYNPNTSYTAGSDIALNNDGVAFPVTTASEMRVLIGGVGSGSQKFDYLRVEYQMPDVRYRRGLRTTGAGDRQNAEV